MFMDLLLMKGRVYNLWITSIGNRMIEARLQQIVSHKIRNNSAYLLLRSLTIKGKFRLAYSVPQKKNCALSETSSKKLVNLRSFTFIIQKIIK